MLFYYTAIVQTDVDKLSANPDVTVEVVAFKWNWQFNYRDGMGEDGQARSPRPSAPPTCIPLLVLPTGKKIRFEETSRDVIHSFWVPEMLFKRDVFPGNVRNVFEVTLDKEGRYVGRCAELCGTYHAFMNFELRRRSRRSSTTSSSRRKKAGKSTQEALERHRLHRRRASPSRPSRSTPGATAPAGTRPTRPQASEDRT